MQKALVISSNPSDGNLYYLNSVLEKGTWKVIMTCPMPSSSAAIGDGGEVHVSKILPCCMVIIEKVETV